MLRRTITGFRDAAKQVQDLLGPKGLDYLLETQGKTPNGLYTETADGLDNDFALQVLSRFGLAYLLAARGVFRDGGAVLTAMSPGGNLPSLDVNDLSLKKEAATKWRIPLLAAQAQRDGVLTDAWVEVRLVSRSFLHAKLTLPVGTRHRIPFDSFLSRLPWLCAL